MDRIAVAKELMAVAKSMTAMISVKDRMKNAEAMIKAGGRGIELGIREVEYLSSDMAELAKHLRRVQGSSSYGEDEMRDGLLEVLRRYKGRWKRSSA